MLKLNQTKKVIFLIKRINDYSLESSNVAVIDNIDYIPYIIKDDFMKIIRFYDEEKYGKIYDDRFEVTLGNTIFSSGRLVYYIKDTHITNDDNRLEGKYEIDTIDFYTTDEHLTPEKYHKILYDNKHK